MAFWPFYLKDMLKKLLEQKDVVSQFMWLFDFEIDLDPLNIF